MPATNGAASRTGSTRRAARSGGAAGLGFPTRSPVRVYTELNGLLVCGRHGEPDGDGWSGVDGSVAPLLAETQSDDAGAHRRSTTSIGAGFSSARGWRGTCRRKGAIEAFSEDNDTPFGDYWDWQVRIGYHPGVRVYVPPPPPPPPAARRRRRWCTT